MYACSSKKHQHDTRWASTSASAKECSAFNPEWPFVNVTTLIDLSNHLHNIAACENTAGYLRFHPMAQCVVHALKGRQAFSRTLRSQKHNIY